MNHDIPIRLCGESLVGVRNKDTRSFLRGFKSTRARDSPPAHFIPDKNVLEVVCGKYSSKAHKPYVARPKYRIGLDTLGMRKRDSLDFPHSVSKTKTVILLTACLFVSKAAGFQGVES